MAPAQEWYVEHLWSQHDLSSDGTPSFVTAEYASRLPPGIDAKALAEAFEVVVRRHQALRAHLSELGPGARLVCPPVPEHPVLAVEDLRGARDPHAAALAAIRELRGRSIDPTSPPITRPVLYLVDGREAVLFTRVSHLALDAWALALLYDELWRTYQDLAAARPVSVDPPAFQYRDFVSAQRRELDGDVLGRRLRHWARTVADTSAGLLLPTGPDRDRVELFREGVSRFELSPEWTARARAFCTRHRVTPYMLLLAAQAALLHRRAPTDDIRIGSTFGGREGTAEQQLLGPVHHGVFYRVHVGDRPGVPELLRRVREAVFDAIEHRRYPYRALIDHLGLRRDPALPVDRKQLYDAYFDLLPRSVTHTDPDAPNPLARRPIPLHRDPVSFPLPADPDRRRAWQCANVAFNVQEDASHFTGAIAYNAALFTRAEVDVLADDYVALLHAFLDE